MANAQLWDWPAILTAEFRHGAHIFAVGEEFIIQAPKTANGGADLSGDVIATPAHENINYLIPGYQLRAGSRDLSQRTKLNINGAPIKLEDWELPVNSDSTTTVQVNEPFGELFLLLAKGLKANAGVLTAMQSKYRIVDLLSRKFEDTFMAIYNSIPQEYKVALSQDVIDLATLPPAVTYDATQRDPTYVQDIQDGLAVYLRLYFGHGAHAVSTYVGMTSRFKERDYEHLKATRRGHTSRHVHYQRAADASEIRVIALCQPGGEHRSLIFIAEELFILLLDSYSDHVKNRADPRESANPVRAAQSKILLKIREEAMRKSPFKPMFLHHLEGFNIESPFFYRPKHELALSWLRSETPDRWIFQCSEPRETTQRNAKVHTIRRANGSTISISLPSSKHFLAADGSVSYYVFIEIMKNDKPHERPYARCADIGCVSDMALANTVGIFVTGVGRNTAARYVQAGKILNQNSINIGGREVNVPSAYIHAMVIRRAFLQQTLKDSVDEKLRFRRVAIWDFTSDWLENEVDAVRLPDQTDTLFDGPSIVSFAENKAILETQWNLSTTDQRSKGRGVGGKCDFCELLLRRWNPHNIPKSRYDQRAHSICQLDNGICKRWAWLHVPATFSTLAVLAGIKRLFFKPQDLYVFNIQTGTEILYVGTEAPELDAMDLEHEQEEEEVEGFMSDDESDSEMEEPALPDETLEAGDDSEFDSEGLGDDNDGTTAPVAMSYDPLEKPDTSSKDKLMEIVQSKHIGGNCMLLVVLNDEDNLACWVNLEKLAHEVEMLRSYYAATRDTNFPEWARRLYTNGSSAEEQQ